MKLLLKYPAFQAGMILGAIISTIMSLFMFRLDESGNIAEMMGPTIPDLTLKTVFLWTLGTTIIGMNTALALHSLEEHGAAWVGKYPWNKHLNEYAIKRGLEPEKSTWRTMPMWVLYAIEKYTLYPALIVYRAIRNGLKS